MSGTSCGACALPVSPESHAGGPPALQVDDEELARRRAAWSPLPPRSGRGYVTQAHLGCDFGFLHFGPARREPAFH